MNYWACKFYWPLPFYSSFLYYFFSKFYEGFGEEESHLSHWNNFVSELREVEDDRPSTHKPPVVPWGAFPPLRLCLYDHSCSSNLPFLSFFSHQFFQQFSSFCSNQATLLPPNSPLLEKHTTSCFLFAFLFSKLKYIYLGLVTSYSISFLFFWEREMYISHVLHTTLTWNFRKIKVKIKDSKENKTYLTEHHSLSAFSFKRLALTCWGRKDWLRVSWGGIGMEEWETFMSKTCTLAPSCWVQLKSCVHSRWV